VLILGAAAAAGRGGSENCIELEGGGREEVGVFCGLGLCFAFWEGLDSTHSPS
jgi:hypothetical protein